jgi:hypothetical protein
VSEGSAHPFARELAVILLGRMVRVGAVCCAAVKQDPEGWCRGQALTVPTLGCRFTLHVRNILMLNTSLTSRPTPPPPLSPLQAYLHRLLPASVLDGEAVLSALGTAMSSEEPLGLRFAALCFAACASEVSP